MLLQELISNICLTVIYVSFGLVLILTYIMSKELEKHRRREKMVEKIELCSGLDNSDYLPPWNVKVTVERCKEGIELPEYKHNGDACMDLRVYPDEAIVIPAGKSHVFDTFLKFDIPEGHVMLVYPRSGLGIKHGVVLRNLTGVIDSNFTDTVKVGLVNTSDEDFVVSPGDRVAQFMIVPYPKMAIFEGVVEDSGRGEGLGSSGVS